MSLMLLMLEREERMTGSNGNDGIEKKAGLETGIVGAVYGIQSVYTKNQ